MLWGQAPAAELVGEFLSAGISSNAQTGEYGFAMNERAWMEFATEAAATMASYGYDMPAGPTQTILQIANAGMQYDKAGRITGYDAGSITTADIGGALVTTAASRFMMSEKAMDYGSNFSTVFGQEYARTMHNNVIGAASGWANRQLGSENRLIQQFGVQGALMGYSAVKGLFDSDTAPESRPFRQGSS